MAINIETFSNGTTTEVADLIRNALVSTELFDSVSGQSRTIIASKTYGSTTVNVLTLMLPYSSGGTSDFFTLKNSTNEQIVSANYGTIADGYGSVSTVGKTALIILSSGTSMQSGIQYFVLCVDGTDNDNIGVYYRRCDITTPSGASSRTITYNHRTFSTECVSLDSSTGVTDPIGTVRPNFCLYPVTAQNRNGENDAFNNTFGIRYSPKIHEIYNLDMSVPSLASTTPTKIYIDGRVYLTDGVIMIEDAE